MPTEPFIPNDLCLSASNGRFAVITGPNMGGKSTFIRQIALLAVMAHAGMPLPCAHASLPSAASGCSLDAVLVRVGAGDDLWRARSTFAMEMCEVAEILRTATPGRSLIILDEIGRGTSGEDGLALAQAITENLALQRRCFGLFATHFSELFRNLLSDNNDDACMVQHLEARYAMQTGSMRLLYKILPAEPDHVHRGNALEVARMAGFPDPVIRTALLYQLALESTNQTESTENGGGGVFFLEDPQVRQWIDACFRALLEEKTCASMQEFIRENPFPESHADIMASLLSSK